MLVSFIVLISQHTCLCMCFPSLRQCSFSKPPYQLKLVGFWLVIWLVAELAPRPLPSWLVRSSLDCGDGLIVSQAPLINRYGVPAQWAFPGLQCPTGLGGLPSTRFTVSLATYLVYLLICILMFCFYEYRIGSSFVAHSWSLTDLSFSACECRYGLACMHAHFFRLRPHV